MRVERGHKPAWCTDLELAERYRVSRITIWRWARDGHLPKPVRLSPGATRWALDEIEEHDARLKARRR